MTGLGGKRAAGGTFELEVESRSGRQGRVALEFLLTLMAMNTGWEGSFQVVIRNRSTHAVVGSVDAGSDLAAAVAFRDVLRERAATLSPDEFLATYKVALAPIRSTPRTTSSQSLAWKPEERHRVLVVLVPVLVALFVIATVVALVWL